VSDFVRVNHPVFGHFSTRRPEIWGGEATDEKAVDVNGKPLPAKPRTSVAKKAADSKSKSPTPGAKSATSPERGNAS
jgi:hypothetical protein